MLLLRPNSAAVNVGKGLVIMDSFLKGNFFFLFIIWVSLSYQHVHVHVKALPPPPPTSLVFQPIQISPAVLPHYPFPDDDPISPMYPSFPTRYQPVLTGKCPFDFSAISTLIDKTSSDCSAPLATFVGNVICCPQVTSLLHIFQARYTANSSTLVLPNATAHHCFQDIFTILASRGANTTLPHICSVKSSNLTAASCPVKDAITFDKLVNTSKLFDACNSVDPLKECCRPACQPAIVEAALRISLKESPFVDTYPVKQPMSADVLTDCKGVVYSWISRKLSSDAANKAFRRLSACRVNKVCPLEFRQPSEVIKACGDLATPNPSCCTTLNNYIVGIQRQMLITNRQAINCATLFGSMLQKGGVLTDIYELCDVDLKDFSLQAYGQEGCLLRSLPSDVVIDNTTGFSFTCDLSDNVAAPWPSSSSISSLTLCAPEMSLPALPTFHSSTDPGYNHERWKLLAPFVLSYFLFCIL